MNQEFYVSTQEHYQLVDIGEDLKKIVKASGVERGLVFIFVLHSTAGLILTENEPGLKKDWVVFLKKLVFGFDFFHNQIDNNAEAHVLAGLLGQGKVLAIENREPLLGTWQQIFLVELDGPRKRKVMVKILSEK